MIILTGATGFIGKNFLEQLYKSNIPCKCLVRIESEKKFRAFLELLSKKYNANNKSIEIIVCDLQDIDNIDDAFKNAKIIIHCAGIIYHDNDEMYNLINYEATKKIAAMAKRNNINKMVYLSSYAVVSDNKSNYALTKRKVEKYLDDNYNSENSKLLIIRPSIVFGEYDDKNIYKIIKTMLKFRIAIVIGKGDYGIQPIYVDDIVKLALEWAKRDMDSDIVNLASQKILKYKNFIELVNKSIYSNINMKAVILSIPYRIVKIFVLCISKIISNTNVNLDTLNRMMNVRYIDVSSLEKNYFTKITNIEDAINNTVKYIINKY